MTQFVALAPAQIETAWPHIRNHLEFMAASARDKLLAEDIAALGASGRMNLWVILDDNGALMATLAAEKVTYPRKKIARISGLVGRDRKTWLHHLAEFEAWAREQGCDGVQIIARKGWAREDALKGYDLTHYLLERDL